MLKKITIAENLLEPETWKEFQAEDVVSFLIGHFKKWPENARLYHKTVSETSDITPNNQTDVDNISTLEGSFYVVIYPGDFVTAVMIIIAVFSAAMVLLNKPKIPTIATRGSDQPSSNNELSNRVNKERINGRIPDIYGQVRSVPDLIMAPYKYFSNNIEIEHSYMCIGRGSYEIADAREDVTKVEYIDGTSVEIYGPNTSPNSGDAPELTIGNAINLEVATITKYASVNGQVLTAQEFIQGASNIRFRVGNGGSIQRIGGISINFQSIFIAGGSITIENATFTIGANTYNLAGTYTINQVFIDYLTLSNPGAVNPDWTTFIAGGIDSAYISPKLISEPVTWIGPYVVDRSDTEEVWCNFVAPSGIYQDNGTSKYALPVEINLRLTPIDSNDDPIGSPEYFSTTLLWGYLPEVNVGGTLKANPTFTGRCKAEVARITPKYVIDQWSVIQEVKWRDLYGVSPLNVDEFGDVTTAQVLTVATTGALDISERKFNALVTRKIPLRVSGETFTSTLYATKRVDEIISAICLDPKIGNRSASEIDFDNIYDTIANIQTYFGTEKAIEFCYTFDSSNLSFEEIITSIANSVFCIAYRRGNKIKLSFEKETDNTTILFNHRNKIPGTETRSVNFGNNNDNDGIEFQYVDPDDDSVVTLYFPEDKSAANPDTVESIGIRNYLQAYFNGKRLYNKVKHQTLGIECDVTQESNICIINDRILISDGTRAGSFEGEVIAQNVLELTLSQDVDLLDGESYTIFLQYYDGSVQSIPITKTSVKNKVILSSAPAISLALDSDLYARTTFIITSNNDPRKTAFILTEKNPKGGMTSTIKAINYDARYYQNDKDYINEIITD